MDTHAIKKYETLDSYKISTDNGLGRSSLFPTTAPESSTHTFHYATGYLKPRVHRDPSTTTIPLKVTFQAILWCSH
jgi:hypothetical protein